MRFLFLFVLSLVPALAQYAPVPSSSYPSLDAVLNAKPAVQNFAGPPSGTCTTGKDFATNTVTGDFYICVNGAWVLKGAQGPSGANGAGYSPATSTTSLNIATGSASFTTQSGLAYQVGAFVRASSAAGGANYMQGLVTSYSGTTMVINVTEVGGSGTHADWNFNPVGNTGAAGSGGSGSGVASCVPASGSGTAYTCTTTPTATAACSAGTTLAFIPDVSGTPGPITINPGCGVKSIKRADGATNPLAGDIVAGAIAWLGYDGAVFRYGVPGPQGPTGPAGSTITYTASHTFDPTADCGNLLKFTSGSILTLANPAPAGTCTAWVINLTGGSLAVSRNGLLINGVASDYPSLDPCSGVTCKSISIASDGSNYFIGSGTNGTNGTNGANGAQLASPWPTVTDGSPIAWSLGSTTVTNGIVTLAHTTATRALNVSNMVDGGWYTLQIRQDATGGAAMTLGTGCTWKVGGGGAGAITLSATANAIDVLSFIYDGTNCLANFRSNFN